MVPFFPAVMYIQTAPFDRPTEGTTSYGSTEGTYGWTGTTGSYLVLYSDEHVGTTGTFIIRSRDLDEDEERVYEVKEEHFAAIRQAYRQRNRRVGQQTRAVSWVRWMFKSRATVT